MCSVEESYINKIWIALVALIIQMFIYNYKLIIYSNCCKIKISLPQLCPFDIGIVQLFGGRPHKYVYALENIDCSTYRIS